MKAMTTTTQPQQKKKSVCASLTVKGRPCKSRCQATWVPFCHSHAPRGRLVECVGGGPLDGFCFLGAGNGGYSFLDSPEEIIIARAEGERLVIVLPRARRVNPRAIIGTYREAFTEDALVLVWQWKAAQ